MPNTNTYKEKYIKHSEYMYINASNETNHLQNLYTHVHYNTMHTHMCTEIFITGPYLFSPSICGICLHSLKIIFW